MEKVNAGLWGHIGDIDLVYEGGHPTAHQLNTVKMILKLWRIVDKESPAAIECCRKAYPELLAEKSDSEVRAMLIPDHLDVGRDEEKRTIALVSKLAFDEGRELVLPYCNEYLQEIYIR